MYQEIHNGKIQCSKCPRNTYSRAGGTCVPCPADATWKGSNGGAGKGCFCLHGYRWDSEHGECVRGSDKVDDISKELVFFVAMAAVTLGGLLL